jgi:hypothetical protein
MTSDPVIDPVDVNDLLSDLEEKKSYLKIIMTNLPLSRMPDDEKQMWISMIPHMEPRHLAKLAHILHEEVDTFTDMYLQDLAKSA